MQGGEGAPFKSWILLKAAGMPAVGISPLRASRAVGNALGANRTPLVVPCHRVVRADGTKGVLAVVPSGKNGSCGWKVDPGLYRRQNEEYNIWVGTGGREAGIRSTRATENRLLSYSRLE